MSSNRRVANMRGVHRTEPQPSDQPERFHDLPEAQQQALIGWIDSQPVQSLCGWFVTSVSIARRFAQEHAWQPENGAVKGALAVSGFVCAGNPDVAVWTFRVAQGSFS